MKIQLINYGLPSKWYPARKHYNDAGADIYSPQDVYLAPAQSVKIPLGFGVHIPDGYMGLIYPRSSMAEKVLEVPLPPIDSGYCGEIHAIVTNHSKDKWAIKKGDRIGQLVIQPIVLADFVETLGEERGQGAFGSTGQ